MIETRATEVTDDEIEESIEESARPGRRFL